MAKQSGLGDNFYVAGYDLSGDIAAISSISGGPATLEMTGINKFAFERIGGRRDGSMEFSAYFNPSDDQAHARLSALPSSDVILSYHRGTALGNPAAALVAKQLNYDGSLDDDGGFKFSVTAQANSYGVEWGVQGTAGIRNDSEGTSGSSVDGGAASSFGLQAYLQVTGFTGTDATIKLQQSSDDGDTDVWADVTGGTFTEVSGITSERIATADDLAVERYLRVVSSGTFTDLSFAVIICRNLTATKF
jgi:hypothetical protein